jgi:hypothetical protein
LLSFAHENFSEGCRAAIAGIKRALLRNFTVPYRLLAANKLREFLSAIAHARRIQIIEELRLGEKDVGSLTKTLGPSSLLPTVFVGAGAMAGRRDAFLARGD